MKLKTLILTVLLAVCSFAMAADVNVVPYPRSVKVDKNVSFKLTNGFTVSAEKGFADAAELLIDDVERLYLVEGKIAKKSADIRLIKDKSLKEEEYKLEVTSEGAKLYASNYNTMVMATTTLLQLIDSENLTMVGCAIEDSPKHSYRTFMLDVARQWVEMPTVEQIVDLCRWYKVRYLQLHLTDDQLFTFESKHFPKLASKTHYTQKQLKALVEYAKQRGIIIIPEFDLPGHSSTMRRHMPELFGENGYSVVDMVNPKAVAAVKKIMKEMMDIFYTSPYFHIGADEAWLGSYEKLDKVKAYVEKKGYDNAHDIYMEFIVMMHEYVKKNGKKTLVWESFQGNGSRKVKIPTDMDVIAWETAYQAPQSLIDNGYKIINGTWKPLYTTPGRRWSPEYIYKWNMRRWENHWNATPAFHNPIQLESNHMILGGQMCAWEMIDHEQLLTAQRRIAAFSENVWNDEDKRSYEDYISRLESVDSKIMYLIFPAVIEQDGFKAACKYDLDHNQINYFGNKGTVSITPLDKDFFITYTTDGTMPKSTSPKLTSPLELTKQTSVKFGLFDANGKMQGYRGILYKHRPLDVVNMGQLNDVLNRTVGRNKEIFSSNVDVALINHVPGAEIRYTVNGKHPNKDSELYTKPVSILTTSVLKAACFVDGRQVGDMYECEYVKSNVENNITTNKPSTATVRNNTNAIEKNLGLDGVVDLDRHWGNHGPAAMTVDLGSIQPLTASRLYTYWDGGRYYTYTIEVSEDGKNWKQVVDRSANTEKATSEGYTDVFKETKGRFVRVNMIKNSANPAVHIVEFRLY